MMPASTAGILQAALREELQQFERQFLPLFATDRERLAAPNSRTHTTLKTLVALTRYFPAEHSVRKAGKQLELIWPPLVHEPRGAVAGKLLHYYFRVRQDLLGTPRAALRQALQESVQALIDETLVSAPDAARITDGMQGLQQLAVFLPEFPVRVPYAKRLSPLAQLYWWQQQLELAAAGEQPGLTAPQLVLAPWLQETRERCAQLCAASDWSLDYFCRSGLARSLWQMRGLTAFAGDEALTGLLEKIGDHCLDLHLAGTGPQAEVLQAWMVRLFTTSRDRDTGQTDSEQTETVLNPEAQAVYEQELTRYRLLLQEELAEGTPLPLTACLITLLYKLTWIFAVAARKPWSRLCYCAYRVALQCWRGKRPLPAQCHAVLSGMALALGTQVSADELRCWRECLLQHWPHWTGDGKRPIALCPDAEQATPLDAVPLLLSDSFTTLVRVPAGSFIEPAAELCRQLLQELTLLEKGAAAMKVWPLEQLCTLLIAVYETHLRDGAELPLILLQLAHRQLVHMLDQSAAWQEAQSDEILIRELEDWLAHCSACREPFPGIEPHPAEKGELLLRELLLTHLGTLAAVLERPVRLHLDMGAVKLDDTRMTQVLDCLKPLVKFMLLDRSVDTRGRHAMHKPRVSTLTVTLRSTSSTLVLSVGEDSHEDALPQAEVNRLQRRLPKLAGPLVCESRAGLGRCFTLTLT